MGERVRLPRALDDAAGADACFTRQLARHAGDARVLLLSSYWHLARGNVAAARQVIDVVATMDTPGWPDWVVADWSGWLATEAVNVGNNALARRLLQSANPAWFEDAEPDIGTATLQDAIAAAVTMQEAGDLQRAQRLLRAVQARIADGYRARGAQAYGNLDVALYALLGDPERALRSLAEVAETPYLTDWQLLERVPQLATVRQDPRFAQAIATIRTKAREQRDVAASEGLLAPESLHK